MDKGELYDRIASLPDVDIVNGIQLKTRCFLCGDSHKNHNKKRLYFKIDRYNPLEPIFYYCFNCLESGIMTSSMLEYLQIDDGETKGFINRLNYNATKDDGSIVNKYKNKKEINIRLPDIRGTESTLRKIKYLYDRIGYNIPLEDFDRLKLIFNVTDFLKVNDIRPNNKFISMYDNDYIGWLSVNNEYIILRDITNTHKMRYVKYNIFNIVDNTNGFYSVRTPINLLTEDNININIAEGPFDILSILYNVYNGEFKNNVFVASCNGSFMNPINYVIGKGLVGDNIIINCWQDNDTKLNFKNIKKELSIYTPNINVYYNTKGKDFGVPKDEFEIDIVKL